MLQEPVLVERILHPKTKQLVGYLVAMKQEYVEEEGTDRVVECDPVVGIGYIVRHPKREKQHWTRDFAAQIAFERAFVLTTRLKNPEDRNFPPLVRLRLRDFLKRCKKYFKNMPLAPWAENLAQKLHVY